MKVILLSDIKNIGKKGQIKDVPDGYARNFLLAKKLAAVATAGSMAQVAAEESKKKHDHQLQIEKLKKLASDISGKKITIKARAKDGKLFGSITAKDIAGELKKMGHEISEKAILVDHIKETGETVVKIALEDGISAQVTVSVEQA